MPSGDKHKIIRQTTSSEKSLQSAYSRADYFKLQTTMENITAEGGNYTRFKQSLTGLDIFLSALNIFLSITASLSNTLILIALHKVTSIYPPTKLLFRCLSVTDLCVGLTSQPLYAIYMITDLNGNTALSITIIYALSTFVLSAVSILTSTAISVDRLLALILGLRYRHVVTLRRVRVLIICVWMLSCTLAALTVFRLEDQIPSISLNVFIVLITLCLLTSNISYSKIYLRLRHHQIQLQENLQRQGQPPNGGEIPLNIARYKKTVSSIAWVQLALLACYLPFPVLFSLTVHGGPYPEIMFGITLSLLYVNSSLNPILYCWKIKDVRQAVKNTIKFNCCPST